MIARLLAGAALSFCLSAPLAAGAQDFAIVNATLAIGDGSEPVPGATVVVRGGKVVSAGAGTAVPPGLRTIDAAGKWVAPGFVIAAGSLGLWDVEAVGPSNDTSAGSSPFHAGLDVSTSVDTSTTPVAVSRAAGITRVGLVPEAGNAIFAGQGAVIDLGADPQAITAPRAFQYVELGEYGSELAGGSRVAAHAVLRNALREARELALAPAAPRREDALLTRTDALALGPVVQGRQPLFVRVERASDIRAVLALRSEFPALKLVIVGADEGWLAARDLAAAGVPVIANPLSDLPTQFESLASTQSNVGRMAAAGVKVAIGRMGDGIKPRNAPQYAGNLVALSRMPGATGLSWGQALAAITSIPAEILGQGERIGSLRPGKAADVVIWDGDPLEVSSGVVSVFIDGVEQNLANHQTRLRDRYAVPQEGSLPKAYDW